MDDTTNKPQTFRLESYGPRLATLAKKEGVKASVILRRALAAYMDGPGGLVGSSEELAALTAHLGQLRADLARVGGNLNQVAHAFNMDEPLDRDALAAVHQELRQEFGRLVGVLKEVRDATRRK